MRSTEHRMRWWRRLLLSSSLALVTSILPAGASTPPAPLAAETPLAAGPLPCCASSTAAAAAAPTGGDAQTAAVAQRAIDAAAATVDFLKYLLTGVLAVAAAAGLVLAFFLGREWRQWQRLLRRQQLMRQRVKDHLRASQAELERSHAEVTRLNADCAAVRDTLERQIASMGDIARVSVNIPFVTTMLDALTEGPANDPDLPRKAEDVLKQIAEIADVCDALGNRRVQSWLQASRALALQALGRLEEAYQAGRQALALDEKHWGDRPYNLACICAALLQATGNDSYRREALQHLRSAFAQDPLLIAHASTDPDLAPIRAELEQLVASLIAPPAPSAPKENPQTG